MATGVCVGCLGSGQCWVCLATGYASPSERRGSCSRCAGSRRCHVCGDVSAHCIQTSRRVLLVDDERHVLDLMRIWLDDDPRCAGVVSVDTGDRALVSLADHCPDTIICDFHLGRATSAEYLPGFRSACPGARIVIHTGNPDVAHAADIVHLGADVVVEKGRVTLPQLVDLALAPRL